MNSNLTGVPRGAIGVYLLHNEKTGETYAGSGILATRQKTHQHLLETNKHWNYRLQKAFNKNPHFDFVGVVIEEGTVDESREAALRAEQSIIDEHCENPLFLNIAKDAEASMRGYKHQPEAIERNRTAARERWSDPEFRARLIEAQRAGRQKITAEEETIRREKISANLKKAYTEGKRSSNAGQVRTEEFCQRNRSIMSELWKDPAYRARQMAAHEKRKESKMNNMTEKTL